MMAAPLSTAEAIAQAVKEVAGLIREFLSGKEVRRLRYRIESAVNYVQVDAREGQYQDVSDKKREELKIHFRKRIFDES